MKKRGLTLVELIGVLVVIGILTLILVPVISNIIKVQKQTQYEQQIKTIEAASKNFGSDNLTILPSVDGEYVYITLGQLKVMGYMDKSVINPLTGREFSECVRIKITKNKNSYIYEYDKDLENIDNCPMVSAPVIISGPNTQYIKENMTTSYLITVNDTNKDILNKYEIKKDKIILTGETDAISNVVEGNNAFRVTIRGGKVEGKVGLKLESGAILKNESEDLIGEDGIEANDKVIVDNSAPEIVFGTNGNSEWAKEATSTITVTDLGSGGDEASYKYVYTKYSNETPTNPFTNGERYTQSNGTGSYYLIASACDKVGNCITEKSNIFRLDNEAPTIPVITLSDDYKSDTWTNKNVTMTYSSIDNGVQGVYYQYSHDNLDYKSSNETNGFDSGNTSWTITWTSYYKYYIRACDSLDNCSASSFVTLKIDKTKPTITSISTSSCSSEKRTITISASDSNAGSTINTTATGSGISGYAVTTTNTIPSVSVFNNVTSTTWTSKAYSSGTYYVWVKDAVGNISSSMKVVLDTCESMKDYCNLYDENGKSSDFFGLYEGHITGNYGDSVNTSLCSNSDVSCNVTSASHRVCSTDLCKEYDVYGWTATKINETYGCSYSRYWCNC